MFRQCARRLSSFVTCVRRFWEDQPVSSRTVLRVDGFEERVVPTVAAINVVQVGTSLTITNVAGATDTVTLTQTAADQIRVNSTTAGVIGTFNGVVSVGVQNTDPSTANQFTLTTGSDLLTASLRQLSYTGTDAGAGDFVDLQGFTNGAGSLVTNPNLYSKIDLRGAAVGVAAFDGLDLPAAGVVVVAFQDTAAVGTVTLLDTTRATVNTHVAFDFAPVTSNVQVNLNAVSPIVGLFAGTQVASFTNVSVNLLANGSTAGRVIAVRGGTGNDNLVGNDEGNLMLGGGGNDILIGNGGNDQLTATRDFSPAIAGQVTNGVATVTAATVVNLTLFGTASGQVSAANGTTTGALTASALYAAFGRFNFGEGAAFLTNTVVTGGLAADFLTANGISGGANAEDKLFGGAGNDGLYGFNNTAATCFGEGGNDVASSNTNALPATMDGGDGDDLMIAGVTGFTMLGGAGADTFQFVPGNPTAVNTVIGGPGNDTFQTAIQRVTLDAGDGADTFNVPTGNAGITDDRSVILISNSTTLVALPALLQVQKVTR